MPWCSSVSLLVGWYSFQGQSSSFPLLSAVGMIELLHLLIKQIIHFLLLSMLIGIFCLSLPSCVFTGLAWMKRFSWRSASLYHHRWPSRQNQEIMTLVNQNVLFSVIVLSGLFAIFLHFTASLICFWLQANLDARLVESMVRSAVSGAVFNMALPSHGGFPSFFAASHMKANGVSPFQQQHLTQQQQPLTQAAMVRVHSPSDHH